MATVTADGVKMMYFFCIGCNDAKSIPSRRGRPPQYCNACITGTHTDPNIEVNVMTTEEKSLERRRQEAEERVNHLEMMLKSRGTHISQNRHRWE